MNLLVAAVIIEFVFIVALSFTYLNLRSDFDRTVVKLQEMIFQSSKDHLKACHPEYLEKPPFSISESTEAPVMTASREELAQRILDVHMENINPKTGLPYKTTAAQRRAAAKAREKKKAASASRSNRSGRKATNL